MSLSRARAAIAAGLAVAFTLALAASGCGVARAADEEEPAQGIGAWFNPATAPFIPIPDVDHDPNSGTTLGLIPTWLVTDDQDQIRKIIAAKVDYNRYFGAGTGLSMYGYRSDDTQWSAVAGVKQHVERNFDYEYQTGILRNTPLSFDASVVYDRNGTPRFYGIGNDSPQYDESNYTLLQKYVQAIVGWNLSHVLQIAYTLRNRDVDVEPGTLTGVEFAPRRASGQSWGRCHSRNAEPARKHLRHARRHDHPDARRPIRDLRRCCRACRILRLLVVQRDRSRCACSCGHRRPVISSLLTWRLRYMPGATNVPFWSLSNIGGESSVPGGEPAAARLWRGGAFMSAIHFRAASNTANECSSLDALGTHLNIEVTPFADVGEVFAHSRDSPVAHLHKVCGLGFRRDRKPLRRGIRGCGVWLRGGCRVHWNQLSLLKGCAYGAGDARTDGPSPLKDTGPMTFSGVSVYALGTSHAGEMSYGTLE